MYRNAVFEINSAKYEIIMGLPESLNIESALSVAVDTSGRVGSVAVGIGSEMLAWKGFSGQMRHSAELFTVIIELLEGIGKRPMDVNNIIITVGPGSFTGLRIAVTLAKMMNLVNENIRIIELGTLDCLALNATGADCDRVGVILDAKRGLFFAAAFDKKNGVWEKFLGDELMTAEKFLESAGAMPISLLGEGLVFYKEHFKGSNIRILDEEFWAVRAENVHSAGIKKAQKGDFVSALELKPIYLTQPDAKIKQTLK